MIPLQGCAPAPIKFATRCPWRAVVRANDRLAHDLLNLHDVTVTCRRELLDTIEIEIASGAEAGRVVRVADRPVVFGRNSRADVVIAADRQTSSRHFQVHVDGEVICLVDLGSTNGTTVNGNRVHSASLIHGDIIEAGATRFVVKASRTGTQTAAPIGLAAQPATPSAVSFNPYNVYRGDQEQVSLSDARAPNSVTRQHRPFSAKRSSTSSGMMRFHGEAQDEGQLADIIKRLNGVGSAYWIVDFARLGQPLPSGVDVKQCCLFPWLSAEAAPLAPQLIKQDELPEWQSCVEEGWGSDAIVLLISDLEKQDILTMLRDLIRGTAKQGDISRGIHGYCWPSVLEQVIEQDVEQISESLFPSIHFAMFEQANKHHGWQLFGNEDRLKELFASGWRIEPPLDER